MRRLVVPMIACLTLGLAPFVPEPHVVGKLRWVMSGARGMSGMDWFDLVLHGMPWVWLVFTALCWVMGRQANDHGSAVLRWSAIALAAAGACVLWSLC